MENFEPAPVPQRMTLPEAFAKAAEFYGTGQWNEAEQLCRLILAARADQPDALKLLALIAAQTQRAAEAERLLAQAIAIRADDPQLLANHATALKDLQRFDEALREYDLALRLRPDYVEVLFNRGATLQALGRADEAAESFSSALALRPGLAEAHYCRGNALYEIGRFEPALQDYEQALRVRPDHAEAHNNLGVTLLRLERFEDAQRSFERALRLAPGHAGAHYNRGLALQKLRRREEALQHYESAVRLHSDYPEAFHQRANLLMELGQLTAALASYDRAVALRPRNAEHHIGRGNALQRLGRLEPALESYDRALRIEPENGDCHFHRGNALRHAYRFAEALQSYTAAYRLRPEQPWLLGVWLHARMQMCAWDGVEADVAELVSRIERGMQATPPFSLLGLVDSDTLQRRAAQIWVEAGRGKESLLPAFPRRSRRSRIRVGYFSAEFHEHATAFLAAQLFERHDHGRFELIAFSFGPDQNDDMRARLRAAFDTFLDVRSRSDAEIAQLAREREIDIAVDLKGYTQQGREGIFAHRAAPIQVSYLGYPGTSGGPHMDYLIADRALIPAESREGYSERIVYLPDSYQPNDRSRKIADVELSRRDLGLPDGAFVFCSFNGAYKITPRIFDVWIRVLQAVPASVLWLLAADDGVQANLRREADARGLDERRLIFAPPMAPPAHLARLRAADLFLDTLPCNAHTTASDALWAGLPVLTRAGKSFAARVGASLLGAAGLPELVTTSAEEYEALAIELASRPERLAELRERLRRNRMTAPLFDIDAYTRHLEAAYTQVYERYYAQLPPDDIHI
ncbi:MAG: tetratricopeptide repeat protein [Steroidobacteraceae bacterium]